MYPKKSPKPIGTHFVDTLPVSRFTAITPFQKKMMKSPFDDLFDQLIDNFFDGANIVANKDSLKSRAKYPKADIYAEGKYLVYRLSVPGIDRDDLKVEFNPEEASLSISYDKQESVGNKEKLYVLSELRHSSFMRVFYLPKDKLDIGGDDAEGTEKLVISSKLENGILEIKVPIKVEEKEESKNPYTIKIR